MKKFLVWIFFGACLNNAHALLNLELTQGIESRLPVAVVPFESETTFPESQQLSKVITKDLENSGQFIVRPGAQQPHSVSQVDLNYWRGLDVQDVVVGSVSRVSGSEYRVTVSLVSAYKQSAATKVSPDAVLFSKVFTVNDTQLRSLAHLISDKVYEILTGVPGVFSTRLAYILVSSGPDLQHPRYHLMVSDYDGQNAQNLVDSNQPLMSPAWSPTGGQVAFVTFQNRRPALYLADVRTGQLTKLLPESAINGAPAWSHDGHRLAFVNAKTGVAEIYVMDLASRQITPITSGVSINTEPSFAPDDRSIVFTSNRGGTPQIYQYSFATKKIERLTYDGEYNAHPSISPDNKYLVYSHKDKTGDFDITVKNLSNDVSSELTGAGEDESPSWSPNSRLIVYARHYQGQHTLGIVSRDGKIRVLLPASEGKVYEPAWSP
jgi:TolB protein